MTSPCSDFTLFRRLIKNFLALSLLHRDVTTIVFKQNQTQYLYLNVCFAIQKIEICFLIVTEHATAIMTKNPAQIVLFGCLGPIWKLS